MCLGIPACVVAISDEENCLALVETGGVRREVNMLCVTDDTRPLSSCVGDWVLVHVGFAMSRIDAEAAHRSLELLAALGEMASELPAMDREPGPYEASGE